MQFQSLLFSMAIVILFASFNKTGEQSCELYRTGKFYIYNKQSKQRINIERKDSLQIETNTETGDISVMKVKWNGACEYDLWFNYMTPKEVSKNKNAQKVFESNEDIPLQIKILGGTDDYYLFEAGKRGFRSLKDTVWLVK